jgi:hypothetical protein
MSKLPELDPAFDASKFEPVEPDWLNTGVKMPKANVLARGRNDKDGFWRPDALPGLRHGSLGREKWNPLTCDLGNNYLADAHWHPFKDESEPEKPFVSDMANEPWFSKLSGGN